MLMSSQRPTENQKRPQDEKQLTIGQLARLTGIQAKNIRYYESIGLLPCPERAVNGYRRYNQADVNRLMLLRRLRLLGVPLAELGPLLSGTPDARCIEVQRQVITLVQARLAALSQEIAELCLLQEQVEQYQLQLASSHINESEFFRACHDLSCLVSSNETI